MLKSAPLFKLILPFIIGILTFIYFADFIPFSLPISISFGLLSLVIHLTKRLTSYSFRWTHISTIAIAFFFIGGTVTKHATDKINSKHYSHLMKDKKQKLIVNLIDAPQEKENSIKLIGNISQVDSISSFGKVILYLQKNEERKKLQYGNTISLQSKINSISAPTNDAEFNYKQYLSNHQIHFQAYIKNKEWNLINQNKGNRIYHLAFKIRNHLESVLIQNGLTNNELGVASALILGIKNNLDQATLLSYSNTGATHILAVSGLHVGIIYLIINSLLLFLNKSKKGRIIKALLILVTLWFYALITGLSPSVLRAATMFSFIVIADLTQRNTNIYNTLAASAFVLLTINPYLIKEIGFQMSYIAVMGIVYLQPKIYLLLNIDNKPLHYIWQLTTVSIAAQIATFPLGLYYFNQFPNYFLLSNLIVIPAASIIVYAGISIFITSPITHISNSIAWLLEKVIKLMNTSIEILGHLPWSTTSNISINLVEVLLIYSLIISTSIFFVKKSTPFILTSLTIVLILVSFNTFEKYTQLNQKQIIVYNIPKMSSIDFIHGTNLATICDSAITNKQKKFHVNNYRINNGVSGNIKDENWFRKDNFIQFENKTIYLLKSKLNLLNLAKKKIDIDLLIYSSYTSISLKNIQQHFNFNHLIIDSSVPYGVARKIKEEYPDSYLVSNQGMFKINI
jgi:competence protein ComEC